MEYTVCAFVPHNNDSTKNKKQKIKMHFSESYLALERENDVWGYDPAGQES